MTTHATPPVLGIPGATAELSARLRAGLARVDALLTEGTPRRTVASSMTSSW